MHTNVCRDFGFPVAHSRDTSGAPSQSRLWEMWNEEFTDVQREFVRTATEKALAFARHQGVPAPDPVFRPEERNISSKRSEQRLVAEKTKEVWQQAKPFVTDTFYLKRADNTVVHENAVWEQHAYMGMRENMYAQSGQHSFYIDSQRDRPPSASNHRYQIGKLSAEETRSMLHETTRMLIEGNPWTGKIERDEADNITEDWILGYKDGEVYYQWATIQIVGYDIPLVLDAIPVKRGMARADIVDDLLENALELVMMDREFDSEGVKDACDKHGVCYLNGTRKHESEKATCTRLRRSGKMVHIEAESVSSGPTRKRMYLPSSADNGFETESEEEDEAQSAERNQINHTRIWTSGRL